MVSGALGVKLNPCLQVHHFWVILMNSLGGVGLSFLGLAWGDSGSAFEPLTWEYLPVDNSI